MDNFKIEVMFNDKLGFMGTYEGFENGIKFAINISKSITLKVPEDTLVQIIVTTPKFKLPFQEEYFEHGGEFHMKQQILTLNTVF